MALLQTVNKAGGALDVARHPPITLHHERGGISMRRLLCGGVALGAAASLCGIAAVVPTATASATSDSAPIVVGGDGSVALYPGAAQGFTAGIYRFNKDGGLDGRKIKFVGVLDDGYSPATDLTNAQQLVENDHVTVVAPFVGALANASTGTFLAQNKTPFIGWPTASPMTAATKWGYTVGGDNTNPDIQSLGGIDQLLTATGNTKTPAKLKLGLIANSLPAGITGAQAIAGVAKAAGVKVVYDQGTIAAAGTTNYAPYAQALIASGANAVYEVLDTGDSVGVAAALKQAGYKGVIVNGETYLPGSLASEPSEAAALNGVYVEYLFPADENNTPAVKQAEKDLVATGQKPYLSVGVSVGYWSAIMLEQMLKATLKSVGGDPSKVTGAAISEMVNKGFTYTSPISGGSGTTYFPADESATPGCGTLLKTVGTGFKVIVPYACDGGINVTTGKKLNSQTGKPIS
jgi:ABC-type branched-subunit amino acid transport system substrate-binding protein